MLGRSVGNYQLVSKIGEGGMGVVYLAQHMTLGRRAAVKVLLPELSSNQDIVSRFFNEARAATAVRHAGIVEVFDFGFLDDRCAYIVMEYLGGESLAARIMRGRSTVMATLTIVRAIARALQAAHDLAITQLSGLTNADDLNPTVVATVSSSNASPVTASSRLRLTAAKRPRMAPLQLSCAPLDKELALGQRLRVRCESTNPSENPVRGVSLQVAVGTAAATPAVGPKEIAPHGHVKFELSPTLPASIKTGSSVPITITMNAPDAVPVQQQIAVRIVEAPGVCKQGKLTRDAYRIKRKRLQDALASGALTQGEFDNYDAEMVSCLE